MTEPDRAYHLIARTEPTNSPHGSVGNRHDLVAVWERHALPRENLVTLGGNQRLAGLDRRSDSVALIKIFVGA